MAKEMIISVNGREKKIAILDNGKVTEFYIERGEENSGVVGNIYKGRVQRVLPGMQSAFVEIGLERDAFLYVSDFFDEEEEIERIIMEKGKKGSPEDARREANDRIERARIEREKEMESVQEIVEPMAETGDIEILDDEPIFDRIVDSREVETVAADQDDDEQADGRPKQRRNRRDRKREKRMQEATEAGQSLPELMQDAGDSNFERIVDDEFTGEMFKDAYRQESIVDTVRAIEFEMEGASEVEVGSLLASVRKEESGFERIADDDEIETAAEAKPAKGRRGKPAAKAKKENAPAEVEAVEAEPVAEAEPAKKASRGRRGGASKGKSAEAEAPVAETVAEAADEKPAKGKKPAAGRGKKGKLADAEASVKESAEREEMTVRRGGRGGRGRRGGQGRNGGVGGTGQPQERYEGSEMNEVVTAETEIAAADFVPTEKPARRDSREGRDNREGRDSRGGRDGRGRDRQQPTITDLLREGQEILVQIAKEPIARKGARITSHIALPGRFLVYMPTIEHLGVSRKIESASERARLRTLIQTIRKEEQVPSGGFIVRTAGVGITDDDLKQDARYLVRTWLDIKKQAEKAKSPALVHQDLDIIQRLLRDQLSDDFAAIRVDSEEEYLRIVEFINRIQPRLVSRVKLYTREDPILEAFGVQEEIDKALKPRVWLRSGGYLVINQTEALVAIDVNTGKFVGKGNARLEDTITKTNMEAVEEIARQIRLRDLGGIIVLDLIDMEDRRNRHKVMGALQDHLQSDKSPTKVLSFNDFGLIIMTRKRVKQSLERTMCAPCEYCQGAGWVKSPTTICYELLEEARRLSRTNDDVKQTTLRVNPEVAQALRGSEKEVLEEIEAYLGPVDVTSDKTVHQEQFDFAFV
ncbi:MAG: Rne/Rng family ribonuclease [Acidobacteria bacterium]|nr:Rne/Rng family ribonuclease [Acidobacteriota bacterium]